VELGNKVYNFLLDTWQSIKKAMTWVWEKVLKAPFKKLIQWLGFIFNWKDILITRDLLRDMVNATLDYGSQNLDSLSDTINAKVDEFAATLRKNIKSPALDNLKSSMAEQQEKKDKKRSMIDQALQWVKYQLAQSQEQAVRVSKRSNETCISLALIHLYYSLLTSYLSYDVENRRRAVDQCSRALVREY
jgi:hypothetical protein